MPFLATVGNIFPQSDGVLAQGARPEADPGLVRQRSTPWEGGRKQAGLGRTSTAACCAGSAEELLHVVSTRVFWEPVTLA